MAQERRDSAASARCQAKQGAAEPAADRDAPSTAAQSPAVAGAASSEAPDEARPKRKRARPVRVTREWVLERLVSNVNRAMQAEAVTLRGMPTGEYRYEGGVANRALELIGKELGLFGERKESQNARHVVSDQPLSEEEWEALYTRQG